MWPSPYIKLPNAHMSELSQASKTFAFRRTSRTVPAALPRVSILYPCNNSGSFVDMTPPRQSRAMRVRPKTHVLFNEMHLPFSSWIYNRHVQKNRSNHTCVKIRCFYSDKANNTRNAKIMHYEYISIPRPRGKIQPELRIRWINDNIFVCKLCLFRVFV